MKRKSPVTTVVATGIGGALFFVLGRFAAIPTPVPNTYISIQYGLLAFMAVLFGPAAGMLIAFIGHTLIDLSYGSGIWWSWVIASAVCGLMMGLMTMRIDIESRFSKADAVTFNVSQIISHIVAWEIIAPLLDIAFFKEPGNKVFVQGAFGGIANIITTAVVGTLLCAAYNRTKPKAGSLRKDG